MDDAVAYSMSELQLKLLSVSEYGYDLLLLEERILTAWEETRSVPHDDQVI